YVLALINQHLSVIVVESIRSNEDDNIVIWNQLKCYGQITLVNLIKTRNCYVHRGKYNRFLLCKRRNGRRWRSRILQLERSVLDGTSHRHTVSTELPVAG